MNSSSIIIKRPELCISFEINTKDSTKTFVHVHDNHNVSSNDNIIYTYGPYLNYDPTFWDSASPKEIETIIESS